MKSEGFVTALQEFASAPKYVCFALAFVFVLTSGCKGREGSKSMIAEETEEEPLPERYENDDLPKAADELFDDFAYYFASNEGLQRRRIAFPLKVNSTDVEEQEWQMDPLFMAAGEYVRIFDSAEQRELANDTTIAHVTIENIHLTADSVRQYFFDRSKGRWQLTAVKDITMHEMPYAKFLNFYQDFATDSAFQQASLNKEISFSSPDPDDDFAMLEGFITPDSWEAFAPELPHDNIYNIVYGKQDKRAKKKVFVVCGISNGLEMELTFQQKRGKWKLMRIEN